RLVEKEIDCAGRGVLPEPPRLRVVSRRRPHGGAKEGLEGAHVTLRPTARVTKRDFAHRLKSEGDSGGLTRARWKCAAGTSTPICEMKYFVTRARGQASRLVSAWSSAYERAAWNEFEASRLSVGL